MNESKRTPGDWKAIHAGTSMNDGEVYNISAGGLPIAEYVLGPDASLMAAAPELLASLEEILAAFTTNDEGASEGIYAQRARAAIAKAKELEV